MDEAERHARGAARRREILGDAHVDRSARTATAFNREFVDLITRYAWGEIWTREHFDDRTRRLLVLSMTLGMGRWEEFRLHVRAALDAGMPADDLKELILQGAIYCGVPAANTAFHIAGEVMSAREEG